MTNIKKYFPFVLLFVLGLAIGRYSLPSKIITKTEIKTVEVIKWKERIVKEENKDKVTIITEETKPDGTKIVRKEIRDKSTIITDKNKEGSKDKESISKEEKIVEYNKDRLIISALASINVVKPQDGFNYGVGVNTRLLGPIWLQGAIFTSGQAQAGIGLSF
jgi:hypothetical protein